MEEVREDYETKTPGIVYSTPKTIVYWRKPNPASPVGEERFYPLHPNAPRYVYDSKEYLVPKLPDKCAEWMLAFQVAPVELLGPLDTTKYSVDPHYMYVVDAKGKRSYFPRPDYDYGQASVSEFLKVENEYPELEGVKWSIEHYPTGRHVHPNEGFEYTNGDTDLLFAIIDACNQVDPDVIYLDHLPDIIHPWVLEVMTCREIVIISPKSPASILGWKTTEDILVPEGLVITDSFDLKTVTGRVLVVPRPETANYTTEVAKYRKLLKGAEGYLMVPSEVDLPGQAYTALGLVASWSVIDLDPSAKTVPREPFVFTAYKLIIHLDSGDKSLIIPNAMGLAINIILDFTNAEGVRIDYRNLLTLMKFTEGWYCTEIDPSGHVRKDIYIDSVMRAREAAGPPKSGPSRPAKAAPKAAPKVIAEAAPKPTGQGKKFVPKSKR